MNDEEIPTSGYVLLVLLRAVSGKGAELAACLSGAVGSIRSEPGIEQFECYRSYEDPDLILLYEHFDEEADWRAHQARPEMNHLRAQFTPLLASEPERTVWTQVTRAASPTEQRGQVPGHVTLVRFRLKPGTVTPSSDTMARNVDDMKGVVRFDLNRSPDDPWSFMICARWTSRAAWEANQNEPTYAAMMQKLMPNYDGTGARTLWRSVPD